MVEEVSDIEVSLWIPAHIALQEVSKQSYTKLFSNTVSIRNICAQERLLTSLWYACLVSISLYHQINLLSQKIEVDMQKSDII